MQLHILFCGPIAVATTKKCSILTSNSGCDYRTAATSTLSSRSSPLSFPKSQQLGLPLIQSLFALKNPLAGRSSQPIVFRRTTAKSTSSKIMSMAPVTRTSSLGSSAFVGTSIGLGAAAAVATLFWMRRQARDGRCNLTRWSHSTSYNGEEMTKEIFKRDSAQEKCIYMDYNGTTPIKKEVLKAMLPYLSTYFGNPSSSHVYGQIPKRAIEQARREVAALFLTPHERQQCLDDDAATANLEHIASSIVFVGCGTEADNMAIHLALDAFNEKESKVGSNTPQKMPHIVTSNVEHPAIIEYLKYLETTSQAEVTYVPVNEEGIVPASEVINAIKANTCLVTIMYANNETGALMPVAEIANGCEKLNIPCHTDAAQAVGKVPIDLHEALGFADMVTVVGHKFGAPKGIGALYINQECLERKMGGAGVRGMLLGGGQENGRRAGTENVPYIVGMGRAASLVCNNLEEYQQTMAQRRQQLLDEFTKALGSENVCVNGPPSESESSTHPSRLPNTLSIGIRDVESGDLLRRVGHKLAASAGAACHSSGYGAGENEDAGVSSILKAMKVPMNFARGTLRLSVGSDTTEHDVANAVTIIVSEVKRQWNKRK